MNSYFERGRERRARGPLRPVACALGLAAALLAGCGGSATTHQAGQLSSVASSSNLAGYVTAADFPVDATDWAAGQQLGAFELAVQDKAIDTCMHSDGFPAPPPIMNQFSENNIQFPDLRAIAHQGFSPTAVPNPPDPTKGMSTAERSAFLAADQRCAAKAQQPFAQMNGAAAALKSEWADVVNRIDATPTVQGALRQFDSCTAKAGVPSSGIQDFLVRVDERTVPLFLKRQNAQADAVEAQLGQTFARCLGPTQALRVRLRTAQRSAFFASHAEQINSVRNTADQVVAKLERQYGVGIPRTVAVQP